MQVFKKSEDDVNGFIPYSLGITAVIVTLTCVAGANVLNQMAQTEVAQQFAQFSPKTVPAKPNATGLRKPAAGIDYGTTAAIPASGAGNFLDHPIILDPCTGKQK